MKIDFEFACRDDCLDHMVPSDLRILLKVIGLLKEASNQSHNGHWDKEGNSGRTCPECIRARELRDKADKLLGELNDPSH
jgi:hypothetical protein